MWSTMFYLMSFYSTASISTVGYYQMALVGMMMIVNLAFALTDIDIRGVYKYFDNKKQDWKNNQKLRRI